MLTFLGAIVAFLIARAMWDAVKVYAKRCGELPIVWLVKTLLILAALGGIVVAFGAGLLYAFSR